MPSVDRLSPALTTVRVRHFRVGAETAEIIIDMVEGTGAQAAHHSILPAQQIARDAVDLARSRRTESRIVVSN